MIAPPPPAYVQTAQALAACGIPAANIRMRYGEDYQSDVVTISDTGPPTEDKFRCVQRATSPRFILEIENPGQEEAFNGYEGAQARRHAKAQAIAWLKERHMLDRVPRYDASKGIDAYQRALEAACRLPAGSALETDSSTRFTFRRTFVARPARVQERALTCLLQMVWASEPEQQGVALVLIGNEAFRPTP